MQVNKQCFSLSVITFLSFTILFISCTTRGGCAALAACDATFPKNVARKFIEDILEQFVHIYGDEAPKATELRAFSKFESKMESKRMNFNDEKDQINLQLLDSAVSGVKDDLVKTVQDVLERGEKLDSMIFFINDY